WLLSMFDARHQYGYVNVAWVIARRTKRKAAHWDMYAGVFEHMAGVYSVNLQGAYNLPGYAQPQYDQYYQ
ncbi:hypothetical protein Tco_1224879, partial [Tanacetum coccineum]